MSSQLFHFTGFDKVNGSFKPDIDALDILKRILQSHYLLLMPNKVHLKLPKIGDLLSEIDVKVHMACFTETPLQFISGHIAKYGKFGLGFTVEWALRNGGQNVVYCDPNASNSYAHTVAGIGGYLMRNGAAYDIQKVRWIAELAAITERFELRHEREWRFLRAPIVDDKLRGIEFSSEDLQTIVCPSLHIAEIRRILEQEGFTPNIMPTEDYWIE